MLPLILWLTLTTPSLAQAPRFSSSSELVVLNVTVVDGKSRHVANLPREAFTVLEDGKAQELGFFGTTDTPATIGLVIDSSISMQRRRDAVVAAGSSFAASSNPDDELFAIFFNESVWPGLPAGQKFTSDREELRQALRAMRTRGQTAFFDGVTTALRQLGEGTRQRKVLVVVSDGGDNASREASFDSVLETALKMDAVIYTVSIRDEYDVEARPELLKKIAQATGGEAFFLRETSDVGLAFERIARDIRSGYTLGYRPAADRAGYRAVKVQVRGEDGRKLTVRCRSGYKR